MFPHRLLFLIFVTLCVPAFGQSQKINALVRELSEGEGIPQEVKVSIKLANLWYDQNFQEGQRYAMEAVSTAREGSDSALVSLALTTLGDYYFHKGDNKSSEYYYRSAIRAGMSSAHPPHEPFLRLSDLFREQALYDSAENCITKVQQQDHPDVLLSRGLLTSDLSENEKALVLLRSGLTRTGFTDTTRRTSLMTHMAVIFTALAQYDSADQYYRKVDNLLQRDQNIRAQIQFYIARGETSFVKGEFSNSIDDYNRALDKLKQNALARPYASLLYLIGELYGNQGVYQTAFEYLFKALKEFEHLNARKKIARANTQIGWAYNFQENYSEALLYSGKSLELATLLKDSASIAQNKNMRGYALLKSGNLNEALLNFQDALAIRRRIKNLWGVSYTLYNTSLVYLELGQRNRALALLNESLATDKAIGNKSGYVFTSNQLGRLYAEARDFNKASHFLNEANSLARQIPLPSQLLANYKNFIFLSELQGDERRTIAYYKRYTVLSDSLNNAVNSNRIAKADALFQLQKKTTEIQLINAESELKQQRIHAQQAEIELQQTVIYSIITGIVILLVLVLFIIRLLRSNIRAKRILSKQNISILEQKEEIQSQAEELTESNTRLVELNNELEEKNFEIESQSEKIKETNNSLEQRVDERTRQLQHAYQELETFFYRTSHDFRRPLTTYLGLVEIAKASIQDEQALFIFNKVKENTLALDGMLTKLQSISNADYDAECSVVALPDLTRSCLERFEPILEAKQIAVTVSHTVETLRTNPHLLLVILTNIIENAVTFTTPLNPSIAILSKINQGNVEITIEDNGQGISQEIADRVFEMYFRGTDNSLGNGLGLYIAKRAAEKLNGTIAFKSRKNQGSTFIVTLPSV